MIPFGSDISVRLRFEGVILRAPYLRLILIGNKVLIKLSTKGDSIIR